MNKALFSSITMLLVLLAATAFAYNVQIKLNSGGNPDDDDKIICGRINRVEFWYQNANKLAAMTNGFAFSKDAGITGSLSWLANGNEGMAPMYATIEPAYLGTAAWNLGGWAFPNTTMPYSMLVGGAALPGAGLPVHVNLTKVYSLSLDATAWSGPDISGGFCVDNVFMPPSGTWTFDAGSGAFAPDFQGNPNNSQVDPSAPPACFDVITLPYVPGDANDDGICSISDALYIRNYVFGHVTTINERGDADCNGLITISDVVFMVNYIFNWGPTPC